jgi:hypothetical protein
VLFSQSTRPPASPPHRQVTQHLTESHRNFSSQQSSQPAVVMELLSLLHKATCKAGMVQVSQKGDQAKGVLLEALGGSSCPDARGPFSLKGPHSVRVGLGPERVTHHPKALPV